MDFSWMWCLLIEFVVMSMLKGGRHDRRHRRMQEQLDDLHNAPPPAPAPRLPGATRDDVERLEQRVRVLERIVTDSGYTLASEIEALRDHRPVAAPRETADVKEKI